MAVLTIVNGGGWIEVSVEKENLVLNWAEFYLPSHGVRI